MRRRLRGLCALAVVGGGSMLSACEHAENYRWAGTTIPRFSGDLKPPSGSRFNGWDAPSVSVYSFATPAATSSEPSLKDLSDRGQAAYIKSLTQAGAKPDDLRDALSKGIKSKTAPTEGAVTVEGSYRRTLVANVTKGWSAAPGDRLVWTWIYVRPLNFQFDGYSIIATDTQILNIEQVTNATTASATASYGKTGSDTATTNTAGSPVSSALSSVSGLSAGVSGSLSNVYTTSAQLNQQYVKLGADILPTELRIYRESERNLDVAGNTLIALTMRVDPIAWEHLEQYKSQRVTKLALANDDGSLKNPKDAILEVAYSKAPPYCPLKADVTLFYQYRRVTSGKRSYQEGQQGAEYIRSSSLSPAVEIVPAGEVRKVSWQIVTRAPGAKPLQLRTPLGYDVALDFSSYEQANNFATWLNTAGRILLGKMDPSIGKAGLVLTSGVTGRPLFGGPYTAEPAPDTLKVDDAICARMNKVPPPRAAQKGGDPAVRQDSP